MATARARQLRTTLAAGKAPQSTPPKADSPTEAVSVLPRFLDPQQLADLFGVPLETVYQWRRKRTGPPGFRVGRHLRYDMDAVMEWVAEQTRKAA